MEEAEALCTRIGIMTAGRLQCLGGQQHLKNKYGGGYTLELRVKEGHEAGVREAIPKLFARATLEAEHAGKLRYELPMSGEGSTRLARVFEVMESQKDGLGVLDYSASQPSLESIFLAIAEKDELALARDATANTRDLSKVGAHRWQAACTTFG